MKRSELQRKTPPKRRTPLSSNSSPTRKAGLKRKPISPASKAQREKVRDQLCAICAQYGYAVEGVLPIDPAHLAARSHGGCDHPDCVIPLCRRCHRQFDDGQA